MKIQVLRQMQYRNTNIYILHFEYIFQYLIPFGNKLYQDHITLQPALFKRLLWRLGIIKNLYNTVQIEEAEKIILSGATKTLDDLNDPAKKEERRQKIKELKIKQADKECVWQARETKQGFYWICLTHKVMVKMVKNEKPTHK